MSELDADPQVSASQLTELDADNAKADIEQPKAAEDLVPEAVTPVVNKSVNHKSSLKESIMSHNLERDHVSQLLLCFGVCL